MKNRTLATVGTFAAVVTLFAFSSVPASAEQFTGSIQTSTSTGTTVNANVFANKADVYLTGGPQNLNSKGLPDGTYYFQVTDPNGSTLLSTDAINCRQVIVTGGVITHSFDGTNFDGVGCSHAIGTPNPANGQVPVQLFPFSTTPNGGGVYKAWLFSTAANIGCSSTAATGPGGLLVSAGGCSKTDNFKITADCTVDCGTPQQSLVSGAKYNDLDVNGLHGPADPPLFGWEVAVTGTQLGAPYSNSLFTDASGNWSVSLDAGTQVTACEVLTTQVGWNQSGPLAATVVPIPVITTGASINATYGPNCWQGQVPSNPLTGLDFGNWLQLGVSKTATPAFTRQYNWGITKDVDKTLVKQVGGTATFNYTVVASQTGSTDSGWAVSGNIGVNNPNTGSVAATVADSIDNGGACSVPTGGLVTLAVGSNSFAYNCTFGSNPGSGTNTATATWAGGAPTGTAPYTFGAPTTTVNKTITVKDNFNGTGDTTLGTVTATDPPAALASGTFNYPHTVNVPANGCVSYPNTASVVQTVGTGPTAQKTVQVCGPVRTGALTIGFWQNKNGQGIITNGQSTAGVCNSGTFLRLFAPFQDLSATATCAQVATYVTNVIKAANCSGPTCNAMLKAQDLATSLDVYFSDPALGGNQIGAPAPIGGVAIDLTKICTNPLACSAYEDVSSAFGGASSLTVLQMLAFAASQSNSGGVLWYGNVKAVQVLAKDAFDAINNGVAFAP